MTEVVARGFWVARCTCEVFPDPVICVPKECISTCFEQFSVECYERPSINDVVNLPRLRNDGIYCTRSNEGQLAQGTASIVRNRTVMPFSTFELDRHCVYLLTLCFYSITVADYSFWR